MAPSSMSLFVNVLWVRTSWDTSRPLGCRCCSCWILVCMINPNRSVKPTQSAPPAPTMNTVTFSSSSTPISLSKYSAASINNCHEPSLSLPFPFGRSSAPPCWALTSLLDLRGILTKIWPPMKYYCTVRRKLARPHEETCHGLEREEDHYSNCSNTLHQDRLAQVLGQFLRWKLQSINILVISCKKTSKVDFFS